MAEKYDNSNLRRWSAHYRARECILCAPPPAPMHACKPCQLACKLCTVRSMTTDHRRQTTEAAQRFGALITELATRAGYDLSLYGGGKAEFARKTGLSVSAVGRMFRGDTLPKPEHLQVISQAVHADVRDLLVAAGVISDTSWPKTENADVISPTSVPSSASSRSISIDEALDSWGIHSRDIRSMVQGTVQQAMRLQRDANRRSGGEAAEGR